MNVLVILLAVVGLGFLILLAIGALSDKAPAPPSIEDPAMPYREGLHAAVRMQRVAQDLEQQIYAEAAQHMGAEAEDSGAQAGERS
jgi:hypothetical protein